MKTFGWKPMNGPDGGFVCTELWPVSTEPKPPLPATHDPPSAMSVIVCLSKRDATSSFVDVSGMIVAGLISMSIALGLVGSVIVCVRVCPLSLTLSCRLVGSELPERGEHAGWREPWRVMLF